MTMHEETGEQVQDAAEERGIGIARREPPEMPISEMLVWICALAGLGAYAAGSLLPALSGN
jgi:hypothetical protein